MACYWCQDPGHVLRSCPRLLAFSEGDMTKGKIAAKTVDPVRCTPNAVAVESDPRREVRQGDDR